MTPRKKLSSVRSKRHPSDSVGLFHKRPRFDMTENGTVSHTSDLSDGDFDASRLGERHWIDKTEYLRLIIQSLHELGFTYVAAKLEAEAHVKHEEQNVVDLRKAVLNGDWDAALNLLSMVPLESDQTRKRAQFLLIQEKFLEAVERREWKLALGFLRTDLAPLNVNTSRLHLLASCLLCPNVEDLKLVAQWDGSVEVSRNKVLEALQEIIPADVMLPRNRLVTLLEQALQLQMDRCFYHNSPQAVPSLFVEYSQGKGMEYIPTEVIHELSYHVDEVWHVEFSHNGKSFASCSLDGVAVIWEIKSREEVVKKLELNGHTAGILYLAWSPNDAHVATTSSDMTLKIWDASTGDCIQTIMDHKDCGASIAWMPDSRHLISSCSDLNLNMWDLEGRKVKSWNVPRVQDLTVSRKGDRMIVALTNKRIRIFDLEGSNETGIIECGHNVSSIMLSKDGTNLLVSTHSRQIQLWELNHDLEGPQPIEPTRVYKLPELPTEPKYIIQTCFGGYNEAFVLSGSEDCKVYMWHKNSGKLLAALEGHSGLVNSVSWNPVDASMFASASDDKTVQIWGTKKSSV